MKMLVFIADPALFTRQVLVIDDNNGDCYACFQTDDSIRGINEFKHAHGSPRENQITYLDPTFELNGEIYDDMDDKDSDYRWVNLDNIKYKIVDIPDVNEKMMGVLADYE